jgi:hypothetical protein
MRPDIAHLTTRVDRLSARADAHDESQRAISDTLVDLTERFDNLSGSVGVLQQSVDQHTATLDQHTATLDQHTGMLAEILRLVGGSAPGP